MPGFKDRGGDRKKFGGKKSFGGGGRGGFGGGRGGFDRSERKEMFRATCAECGDDCQVPFRPSAGGKPVLCNNCFHGDDRPRRDFGNKFGRDRDRDFDKPKMHEAVCDDCGDDCEVPFRPSGDKPVLCSECFGHNKGKGGGMTTEQFDLINSKLDRILQLITPVISVSKEMQTEMSEIATDIAPAKPTKAKKSKKTLDVDEDLGLD